MNNKIVKPVNCMTCKYCREMEYTLGFSLAKGKRLVCGKTTEFGYNCFAEVKIVEFSKVQDKNFNGKCKDYTYQKPKLGFWRQPKFPDVYTDFDEKKIK